MINRKFQQQPQKQHEQFQQEAIEHEQPEAKLLTEYNELKELLEYYKRKEMQCRQWLKNTKNGLEGALNENLHSARSNLVKIQAILELFRQGALGELNEKQQEWICNLSHVATGLAECLEKFDDLFTLINDFIRFLGMEPLNIQHIAHEASLSAREKAITKGLQFFMEIAPHLPLIFAHPGRIRYVLDHVLSHAVTFTE